MLCLITTYTYAAFPIKMANVVQHQLASVSYHDNITPESKQSVVHYPLYQRGRDLFCLSNRHRNYRSSERSGRRGLSVLSGALGLAAVAGLAVMGFMLILALFGGFSAVIFPYLVVVDFLIGITSFVLGVLALKQRQRASGLAITGVILGSLYILCLLYSIGVWGIGGTISGLFSPI